MARGAAGAALTRAGGAGGDHQTVLGFIPIPIRLRVRGIFGEGEVDELVQSRTELRPPLVWKRGNGPILSWHEAVDDLGRVAAQFGGGSVDLGSVSLDGVAQTVDVSLPVALNDSIGSLAKPLGPAVRRSADSAPGRFVSIDQRVAESAGRFPRLRNRRR
jgi:hypothetical protein